MREAGELRAVPAAFTSDPTGPLAVAGRAAAAGYDAVFVYDHLFPPGGPDRPSIEPFALLSAAAAANPGLGVGVLVTRPGFRPFGIMAKEAAALATISGRTAVLGLGLGDRFGKAEHAVLGLPYPPLDERAVVLEETSLALRWLFRGDPWPGGDALGPVAGPAAARVRRRGLDRRHLRARRAGRRPHGQRAGTGGG